MSPIPAGRIRGLFIERLTCSTYHRFVNFRCLHLYESGEQCASEVLQGSDFCEDHHLAAPGSERLEVHPLQRLAIRVVALILLLTFLIPFYFTLKAVYLELPARAEEGG
jgi:hypothetical protein